MSRVVFALLAALALPACPSDDPVDPCTLHFVGDPQAAPEMQLVIREGGGLSDTGGVAPGEMRPLGDGDTVPIIKPPQGGKVIFPAVRVRNIDVCGTYLKAFLRDECTGLPLDVDKRPARFRVAEDGWAEPSNKDDISNFSNPQVCPWPGLSRDVHGNPFSLTVELVSKDNDPEITYLTRTIRVTPVCAETDFMNECRCECDRDYRQGDPCTPVPDAGLPEDCP